MADWTVAGTGATGESEAEALKQRLMELIDDARRKLDDLRDDVVSIHYEDVKGLHTRRDALRHRIEEHKDDLRRMRGDIEGWEHERISHTRDAIDAWKHKRENHKLKKRADRAEEYAVQAVMMAALDVEEAEQAVLDALVAKFDAEMAVPS